MKLARIETVHLDKIVNGGQALGALHDGKKIFVWGGLPGETVRVQLTKQKASYAEGYIVEVIEPCADRVAPADSDSYLSTSPWQVLNFATEQRYKAQLIEAAFQLHGVSLPAASTVFTDNQKYHYRNKVEFSWWWENDAERLDLAFFRRGTKEKLPVSGTSLARAEINDLATSIRDLLSAKHIEARALKTLLIRCNQAGDCVWHLYCKERLTELLTEQEAAALPAKGGEIIYSDPRSPASRITERLAAFGDTRLEDTIMGVPYGYAAESFFQVNLPVYEQTLRDMQSWVLPGATLDLYSGVGSIGLSIASGNLTLVEIGQAAHRELAQNVAAQHKQATVQAILSASEKAVEQITNKQTVIVDPPRAGLHSTVTARLLDDKPPRIIYLSCNPVTQARDIALLLPTYKLVHQQGYNFFPRTPHIEHLVVLERA